LDWHARGLIDLLACPDVRKNVAVRTASIRRAKAHFLCLGVLPLVLCLTGIDFYSMAMALSMPLWEWIP
jgi:hypothetical protein